MLGRGHLSACVPGTSTPRGLPRLPGGGVGEGRLALGVELTTSSAQLRDPRRSDRPRLPQTPEPPPHAACTSAGACCRQAEVGLQLGAGNMTRTQGFRARGQFTLRAPCTAQPRHSGQGPDGPVGEAAHHSGCEEPQTRLPLPAPGDTGTGGPAAPRPEGSEARAGEAHRPRHCPRPRPVHAAASGLDLAGRGRRGHGRSQGAEVQPPRAGRSQLQDRASEDTQEGRTRPPPARSRSSLEKGAAPPTRPVGWGPPPGHACPSCPSSWPGWG